MKNEFIYKHVLQLKFFKIKCFLKNHVCVFFLFFKKKFRKLSFPSQKYFQLQPPPVRCLPETPAQLKVLRAWGT